MTATLDGVTRKKDKPEPTAEQKVNARRGAAVAAKRLEPEPIPNGAASAVCR